MKQKSRRLEYYRNWINLTQFFSNQNERMTLAVEYLLINLSQISLSMVHVIKELLMSMERKSKLILPGSCLQICTSSDHIPKWNEYN